MVLRNRGGGRSRPGRATKIVLPDVDIDAVKGYWFDLTKDEKLFVLHFDDPLIVERVYQAQRDLSAADLRCYSLGLRGQDAVRDNLGMDQFAMECDPGSLSPVAFYAKQQLVDRENFFDYIESFLGGSFLKTRPEIDRMEWANLLTPSASSWKVFMTQIMVLVELAILHAYRNATNISIDANDDDFGVHAPAELSSQAISLSAKRRARKKRLLLSLEAGGETAEIPDEESTVVETASTLSIDPPAPPVVNTDCLNFDWSTEGPPIDATVESSVELQVDWSTNGSQPNETRWLAWLPNGLTGNEAAWHWVADGPPALAFIKNTFLETTAFIPEPEDRPTRTRSVPAPKRQDQL
jgi:hypothetical protein